MDDSSHSDYYFSSVSCSLSPVPSSDASSIVANQQAFSHLLILNSLNSVSEEIPNV